MGILRTIKRDLGAQINISRNAGEGAYFKVKRAIYSLRFTIRGVWLGVKAMREEQLGSKVIYQGRECSICNWAGSAHPTLSGDDFYKQGVPRAEITNVVNLQELYHRFDVIFGWYMGSWHAIDVSKKMYPRLHREVPIRD